MLLILFKLPIHPRLSPGTFVVTSIPVGFDGRWRGDPTTCQPGNSPALAWRWKKPVGCGGQRRELMGSKSAKQSQFRGSLISWWTETYGEPSKETGRKTKPISWPTGRARDRNDRIRLACLPSWRAMYGASVLSIGKPIPGLRVVQAWRKSRDGINYWVATGQWRGECRRRSCWQPKSGETKPNDFGRLSLGFKELTSTPSDLFMQNEPKSGPPRTGRWRRSPGGCARERGRGS